MPDVTGYFTDRAEDYARFRPSYPVAAIRECLAGLPTPADVVDVGAGTGIAARLFAAEGARVVAVEPNAQMRKHGQAAAKDVTFTDGTAEATGLSDACADLVVCAQAFHWFDGEPALREFQRLLRPGGRLALIWNVRQDQVGFAALYHQAVIRAKEWAGSVDRVVRNARVGDPAASEFFQDPRRVDFENDHRLDWDQLIGRAASASYFPPAGPERDALTTFLRAGFDDHAEDGHVVLAQITEVTLCVRTP
jgi:ubiquinone/menaquinone biosynthesis C-methylase UbiE